MNHKLELIKLVLTVTGREDGLALLSRMERRANIGGGFKLYFDKWLAGDYELSRLAQDYDDVWARTSIRNVFNAVQKAEEGKQTIKEYIDWYETSLQIEKVYSFSENTVGT